MTEKNKQLIIGGDSLIGRNLNSYLIKNKYQTIITTRRKQQLTDKDIYLDLTENNIHNWNLPGRLKSSIKTAFFCTGITKLEQCRVYAQQTRRVNVDKTIELSKKLIDVGVFVVFLSSNLVYDGTCQT